MEGKAHSPFVGFRPHITVLNEVESKLSVGFQWENHIIGHDELSPPILCIILARVISRSKVIWVGVKLINLLPLDFFKKKEGFL